MIRKAKVIIAGVLFCLMLNETIPNDLMNSSAEIKEILRNSEDGSLLSPGVIIPATIVGMATYVLYEVCKAGWATEIDLEGGFQ